MLNKILHLTAVLSLVAVTASCSDNGGGGGGADGCVGHLCGSTAAITDPEGGNVIFEYIYVDTELAAAFGLPSGINTISRSMGYFMDAQTPQDNPLPMPGQCNNLATTHGWPLWVGTPHTDIDLGAMTITGKNAADAAVTIDMPKKPAGTDGIGRAHDIYYQEITPVADSVLQPSSQYDVHFAGAGTFPAVDMTGKQGIFLPPKFEISAPAFEDNGPLVPGTDFTVHWTSTTPTNLPAGDEVLGVAWLLDSNGSPVFMCPTAASAGSMTIPGSAIAAYKTAATARGANPNKVILSRQNIVHQIARLPNGESGNLRRVDMLGIYCWVQLMDVN
jgi:hypothetical protein